MKTTELTKHSEVTPRPSGPRHEMSSMFRDARPMSTVHFSVHPGLPELQREAEARGWISRGFTALSVPWMELRWTRDGWKTTQAVSSNDVPSPVVNGTFHLVGCEPGTDIEFAIHVGLACHAPHDSSYPRDIGDVWLNNEGKNYRQTTK